MHIKSNISNRLNLNQKYFLSAENRGFQVRYSFIFTGLTKLSRGMWLFCIDLFTNKRTGNVLYCDIHC